MPRPRRTATRAGVVAALFSGVLAVSVVLGGCTPGPDPKPTPTPMFTSEADAFKAAEKVYREYVDALGREDAGGAEDITKFLGGTALDSEIDSIRERKARGLTLTGKTTLVAFQGKKTVIDASSTIVDAVACIDVSGTILRDSSGADVTPSSRSPRGLLSVEFSATGGKLLIVKSDLAGTECA